MEEIKFEINEQDIREYSHIYGKEPVKQIRKIMRERIKM